MSGPRIENCTTNNTLCPTTVPTPGEACAAYGTCFYRERTCFCRTPTSESEGAASTWSCDERPADCPAVRPFYGTPCSEEGKLCDYSACGVIRNTQQACENGVWRVDVVRCDGGL